MEPSSTPAHLEIPGGPILGAASVHGILAGWPEQLQNGQVESAQHDGESADVAEPVGQPG